MPFRFAGESHTGCEYRHNEDAIGWSVPQHVWLIADGMGGYEAGEVASGVAKQAVLRGVARTESSLVDAVLEAHQAILEESRKRSKPGMGSTLTLLQIEGRIGRVVWVGDTRAWLWRSGRLSQINRDHSYVQALLDEGQLEPHEAYAHPRSNELLQALGHGKPVPEQVEIRLRSRDWLLLSTDGLHDKVDATELAGVLRASISPNMATQKLIQAALDHQTDDNVSVIVIECPDFPPETLGEKLVALLRWNKRPPPEE